jgi:hypothetical protein
VGWSALRVASLQSNAKLLEEFAADSDPAVARFVAQEIDRLRRAIEGQKSADTAAERADSGRFE